MSKLKSDSERYLRKLFLPGELVCYADHVSDTKLTTIEAALQRRVPAQFVSLNPLATQRVDSGVTSYRNFLIEFDGLSLDEQAAKLASLEVPYATVVYSGGKSLHAVIALTEDVGAAAYAEIAELLGIVLWQSDPTQKNPSRLTRVGGATRAENGVEQSLLEVRRRISKDQLVGWLARFEKHIARTFERRKQEAEERAARLAARQAAGAFGLELVDERTIAWLRGEPANVRSRHARLVAACFELFECGVEYEEALALAEFAADAHGITADPRRAREAEQVVNYVYGLRRKRR